MSGEEMRDRQLATIKGHAEIQRLIRDNEEVAQQAVPQKETPELFEGQPEQLREDRFTRSKEA